MLIDNLNQIRYRIRAAAERAGRAAEAVELVAVTKYASLADVRRLIESGAVAEVGENRVLDAARKKAALGGLAARVRWRLIGHLQTNKARKAVEVFDAIDTIDSERVAAAVDAACAGRDTPLPVMVQVKLGDRASQSGVSPELLEQLLAALKNRPRLRVDGLMAMAPASEPIETVRSAFQQLRRRRDALLPEGRLSMGMSRDYEVAVEEGADLVRIGTQIFPHPSTASLEAPA